MAAIRWRGSETLPRRHFRRLFCLHSIANNVASWPEMIIRASIAGIVVADEGPGASA
jgi:hypothetical protein